MHASPMAFVSSSSLRLRSPFVPSLRCTSHPRAPRSAAPPVFRIRMGLLDSISESISNALNRKPITEQPASSVQSANPASPLLDDYFRRVETINDMEPQIESMSDSELEDAFSQLRADVHAGKSLDDIADRVFALVREATFRVLSLRHYDVQLVGGMVLHDAAVSEMTTGEGKTIVAALPAVLNALSGKPVFIVTVNDYLARRDAELVGQVFRFCGFSVGLIQSDMSPQQRRTAYQSDVIYVTNSELGFDYLRDNLAVTQADVVLTRPLAYCIIDEADSILIDEARTPLIISGREAADANRYAVAKKAADALVVNVHYNINEKEQSVLLTEQGYSDLEGALRVDDLFDPKNPWAASITNALKAKELFKKDINYIVGEIENSQPEIQIVDEFTGRVLKGRRWSDGLHQAVEAKEGIQVNSETTVSARISYQSFFKLFEKLAGMTGTASTEAKELFDVYGLSVFSIPTALPMARKDYSDVVFKNATGKFRGVMREIAQVTPTGRPILIGTTSVEASEVLSQLLEEVEVAHDVLNAKPESALRESEIIAQAGRKYSITIATNMAGRGTDILLGGNAEYFARSLARKELVSLNPQLYESLTCSDVSILIDDDDLPLDISVEAMEDLASSAAMLKTECGKDKLSELSYIDEIVGIAAENGPLPVGNEAMLSLRNALMTVKSELEETVLQEREEVLDLGGLYIIGTERAESRRVDNQLRGRAGRQGDPGGSRFFLSLEDNMFRVFGGDKVTKLLESFRVDEDTPIENPLVNQTLDGAQKNVEEYFRGIRETVLQFDDVLSTQRSAFYSTRRQLLMSDETELNSQFLQDCTKTSSEIVEGYVKRKGGAVEEFEKMSEKLKQFYGDMNEMSGDELKVVAGDVERHVLDRVTEVVARKKASLNDLKSGLAVEVLRYLWLTQMDNLWKEHMRNMENLKETVNLRSYGNEEPLQVFQTEGYDMFMDMMATVRRNNVYSYFQYKVGQVEAK